MFSSGRAQQGLRSRAAVRASRLSFRMVATAAVLAVSLTATALAAGSALTLGSASNSTLSEQVVVNTQGRTLYALSPETATHLLCKTSECFKHWPPLTVGSAGTKLKAGTGVQGHLAILRRSNGMLQVTLRGLPLYRYSGDNAKGQANGEGIKSFGGTWHAAGATSSSKATQPTPGVPSMPSAPTSPSSTPEPYPYGVSTPSAPTSAPTPAATPSPTPSMPSPAPANPSPYPAY